MGVGRRHAEILCIAAVQRAAKKLGPATQIILPRKTGGTLLARKPGIDYHPVAFLEPGDSGSHSCNLSCAISAENQGRRKLPLEAAVPCPGVEVQAVQGGGPHPHLHVPGPGLRLRPFAESQDLRPSMGLDVHRLHQW